MSIGTHWPDIQDYAPRKVLEVPCFDKVVHTSFYLGLGLLWAWVLAGRGYRLGWRTLGIIFVGGALWGILDETTQAYVQRQPDIWDWSCDVLGLGLAVGIVLMHARWVRARRSAEAAA